MSESDFEQKSSADQDGILAGGIEGTFSRYGKCQPLSRRSWINIASGLKSMYNIDIRDSKSYPKSESALCVQIQEIKAEQTENETNDVDMDESENK